DEPEEIRDIAEFIAAELGSDTPWHISRFFPHYKMPSTPPTPPKTLQTAYQIGKEAGLDYIYMGNIAGEANTSCPQCGTLLIRRSGYYILEYQLEDRKCPSCGLTIPGMWEKPFD
ncbi:MAG: AmmeMemoRadiSam system radical SAM enzyme, partial [Anaerolineales bacterium]